MTPRPVGDNWPVFPKVILAATTALVLSWAFTVLAFAEVSEKEAVRVILAEAENQSLEGMVAVGEVIRRRGSLKGFSNRKPSEAMTERAKEAWRLSANTNLSKGATLFENIVDFGFPESWNREKVVCVERIGKHYFFQEVA